MSDKLDRSFLGTGWGFPPTFSDHNYSLELVSEEADIRQSLFILISTAPGERILNPGYGCDLHKMVFERITQGAKNKITDMVTRAILLYEPRVIVETVETFIVSMEMGQIHIVVTYTIIKTNTRHNIVYPFYINEGTNISI
jgi:uncharacterized protein